MVLFSECSVQQGQSKLYVLCIVLQQQSEQTALPHESRTGRYTVLPQMEHTSFLLNEVGMNFGLGSSGSGAAAIDFT